MPISGAVEAFSVRRVDILSLIIAVVSFGLITCWPLLLTKTKKVRRVIAALGTILSVIAGVDYFFGRPWPTDPEIHPHDVISDLSLVLPFKVRNKSAFDMTNVEFRCGIDLVWAADAQGQQVVIRDVAFKEGVYSVPARSDPINYPCDASDLLKVRADGTMSLHGSSTTLQTARPTVFVPPWRILKMCIWIGGEYKFWWYIPLSFTTMIYQWPAAPNVHQWIEGPIVREPPKEEQLPGFYRDALQCSASVRFPYALVIDSGNALLILK